MASQNEGFAREVDEELRVDRLRQLWERWRWAILAVVSAVVLGTVAAVGWDAWRGHVRTVDARAFDDAIRAHGEAGPTADALAAMAEEASTGYASIARLSAAQLYESAGDPEAALGMLDAVAADGGAPERYRSLAELMALAARFEELSPDAAIAELQPLAEAGDPWSYSARELTAAAELRAGDRDAAIATLRGLVDDSATPSSLRARARELLAALGAEERGDAAGRAEAAETGGLGG